MHRCIISVRKGGTSGMKRIQIAIYLRLSKEDGKWKVESYSITMQRMLLHRYVEENFSDYDLFEFVDDGYTGTNFERPGMQSMLEMVKELKIDCIIVKDFSRFARDYIELSSYLEQIFPFMGVRFTSVNDGYDSNDYHGSLIWSLSSRQDKKAKRNMPNWCMQETGGIPETNLLL